MRVVCGSENDRRMSQEKEHGTADAHNSVVLANHKLLQKWVGDKIKQGPGDWVSAVFTAGENLLCH